MCTFQPFQVYLKYKDSEVPKKEVLQLAFALKQTYNTRLEILNPVFRPRPNSHLAPQKTQTNDMQASLLVRAKAADQPVTLNSREVLAEVRTVAVPLGGASAKQPLKG